MPRQTVTHSLLAVTAALSLGLAACSSDSSDDAASQDSSSSAEQSSPDTSSESPSEPAAESSVAESSPAETSVAPSASAQPSVDPSAAASAEPSAASSSAAPGTSGLSGAEKALADELLPLALPVDKVPGTSGQGQTGYIPQAEGEPLHLTFQGVQPEGACATAIDTLNAGQRKPDGSAFTAVNLDSGSQVQTGVLQIANPQQVVSDLDAVADACKDLSSPGVNASVKKLSAGHGIFVKMGNATERVTFAMALQQVQGEKVAVVLATGDPDTLTEAQAADVLTAQVEHAKTAG